jgi:hypothetical protein
MATRFGPLLFKKYPQKYPLVHAPAASDEVCATCNPARKMVPSTAQVATGSAGIRVVVLPQEVS